MVPGPGDRHLEELGVAQDGVGGSEPAAGVPVDAHATQIDERIAGGELLDDRDVVRYAVVDEVAVVAVVERLGAVRRPQVIDLHHHEAHLSQCEVLPASLELPGADAAYLGPRVDVRDDRVFGVLVQVGRQIEHPVQIGNAVTCLRAEHLGRGKADLLEAGDVRPFQLPHDTAVGGAAQHRDRRLVNARVRVHEVAAARREHDLVIGVLGGEQRQVGAVEPDVVHVRVVGVAPRLPATRNKMDALARFIDVEHFAHDPGAGGDLVLEVSVAVEAIEMPPTVALRPPDHVIAALGHVPRGGTTARPAAPVPQRDEGLRGIAQDDP